MFWYGLSQYELGGGDKLGKEVTTPSLLNTSRGDVNKSLLAATHTMFLWITFKKRKSVQWITTPLLNTSRGDVNKSLLDATHTIFLWITFRKKKSVQWIEYSDAEITKLHVSLRSPTVLVTFQICRVTPNRSDISWALETEGFSRP